MALPLLLPAIGWIGSTAVGAFFANLIRTGLMFGLKFFFVWLIAALGMGFVSYVGLKPIFDLLFINIWGLTSFPPEIMPYMGMLNLDRVISVWSSAFIMKLTKMAMFSFRLNNLKLA